MYTPLFTTTTADWEQAEETLGGRTSGASYVLHKLTDTLDAQLHHIVLDPETRTIWWAYDDNPPTGDGGWVVEQLTPKDAATVFSNQVELVQDWQDDPDSSPISPSDVQDVLDEYTEILRLTLPADPREARQHIHHERRLINRQDALWQRTYAEMVRDLAGTKRGGNTRAGEALGITSMQVGRIIRDDDQRRAALAGSEEQGAQARKNR